MGVFGVDYAWGRPGTAALKKAGAAYVCRYLSYDTTGKNLTPAEARELSDAGISIVVVWESGANRALAGHLAGASDAAEALRQAVECGMPADRPIYFAVDFDASAAQQPALAAYLDGAASVIGRSRVGLYGGYGPVKRALDAGKATWGWQTYAWSGGRWDTRAQLRQYSNDHVIGGVGVDYDTAVTDDFGQWRVGAGPQTQEDLMQTVADLGSKKPQTVPAGKRASISFEAEWADPAHVHTDVGKDGTRYPSIFPAGTRAPYLWSVQIEATGPVDATAHLSRYERTTNTLLEDMRSSALGAAPHVFSAALPMDDKNKYRLDLENHTDKDLVVTRVLLMITR